MKPQASTSPETVQHVPTREDLTLYMPLVYQVVARMLRKLPPNVLRDDLVGAGTFGLIDALRKSVDRGPAFEWYARIRIRGAVVDELRTQDWLTRRARTRVTRAQALGESSGAAVVGFDDLPGRKRTTSSTSRWPHRTSKWNSAWIAPRSSARSACCPSARRTSSAGTTSMESLSRRSPYVWASASRAYRSCMRAPWVA